MYLSQKFLLLFVSLFKILKHFTRLVIIIVILCEYMFDYPTSSYNTIESSIIFELKKKTNNNSIIIIRSAYLANQAITNFNKNKTKTKCTSLPVALVRHLPVVYSIILYVCVSRHFIHFECHNTENAAHFN